MLLNPDQQQQDNHHHHHHQHQQQQLQQMAFQAPSELDPAYAQFRDQTRFWIQRVAVPLLMVIGLFGNLITVIIMTRRRMRSTTNMYLAALAFVDMLYLVLTFLLGLSHYPNMAGQQYYAYWKLRPFLMMLTDACSNTSVWLTVTFTIERYIAVKYPMKGKVWCTEVRARMLIVCVFVFGILFAAPVPFEWKVIEKKVTLIVNDTLKAEHELQQNTSKSSIDHDLRTMNEDDVGSGEGLSIYGVTGSDVGNDNGASSDRNTVGDFHASLRKNDTFKAAGEDGNLGGSSFILALDYSDFGKNETYKTIYYWSTAVIFYFIPLFSLMLFNGFLIKSVHQSKRERTKMTRPSATSSTQSSTPKTDISVSVNGSGSGQSLMRPQNGMGKKFKLLRSSSRHKGNLSSKDSSTVEESSQSSPLLEDANGVAKRGNLTVSGLKNPESRPTRGGELASINKPPSVENPSIPLIDGKCAVTIGMKNLKELNVQINCDNESVSTKPIDENAEQNTIECRLNQNQLSKTVETKENIKTIGGPQSRYSSLRRSHMTNSSSRSHHSMVPGSSQERRITIMLIAVVILFLVCQIPSAAMLLYTSVHELIPNTNEHALVLAFGNIFNFLMAVNAAGNFILYSFLSKKYRRTFMILFCRCLGSKQKYTEPKRLLSVRFESSGSQAQRNSSSIYQNSKTSEKVHRDTLV